jgi:hypothetical protein
MRRFGGPQLRETFIINGRFLFILLLILFKRLWGTQVENRYPAISNTLDFFRWLEVG